MATWIRRSLVRYTPFPKAFSNSNSWRPLNAVRVRFSAPPFVVPIDSPNVLDLLAVKENK